MDVLQNPFRGPGLPQSVGLAEGDVSVDPTEPLTLLTRCPAAMPTPLQEYPDPARQFGVDSLLLKDERARMGLGSFKALGAAYVIAREAALRMDGPDAPADRDRMAHALDGSVYACASAGNHGLSVAAGARLFGATAVIYLADSVPEAFADRLRRFDAEVVRPGGDYGHAMATVAADAERKGWTLLSDSSWPGYIDLPRRVMEGYLVMGTEVVEAMERPPTHIFLQAGVGGLAAAMTALFRDRWGDTPAIVIVEPDRAPALIESIRAGHPVATNGAESNMGRLDCKEPSHLALGALARGADHFVTITDDQAAATATHLATRGFDTTPSGAAGVAALQHADGQRGVLGLTPESRILAFISEGREDA
ncbi:pyridoxal-phosphate dependent enzyme [Halofilum ochraceum]|uniref:pyridoxal-phosphate dependent enzyme n=1 Tax=Halofilum ochraceum TaxID=1611323 RepID=UPI0008DA8AAB|nr:pyridoxal-phosphate dependent enzyme [Halofilum ochraceum]